MKRRRIKTIFHALLFSIVCTKAVAEAQLKHAPEVTFDKVEAIFGHNLDTDNTALATLLLAIGMDHTTPSSPYQHLDIGIPFIVNKSPDYWVKRLNNKDNSVDVLVNNALLLLFTKEDIPNKYEMAVRLMEQASEKGYWPARYFIAEHNLERVLSQQTNSSGMNKKVAEETMSTLNQCADIGFAPCQYRIGFWLSSQDGTLKDGLTILQQAIKTTVADQRYDGVLDAAVVNAAKEIVMKGDYVGIDRVVREEYFAIFQQGITKMSM